MVRGISFLLVVLTSVAMGTVDSDARKVDRANRLAIVVVELAEHAPPDRRFFYEFVEAAALAETKNRIKPVYGKVMLLTGKEATLSKLLGGMRDALAEPSVRSIDLFLHLHGSPGSLTLREGSHPTRIISDNLRNMKGLSDKLRAVNSTACWGATHLKDFLNAGFKVASGSRKVNANGAHDVPAFLSLWGKGETYSRAQEAGNDARWIRFYDGIAGSWGIGEVDSFKDIEGRSDLTISDAP